MEAGWSEGEFSKLDFQNPEYRQHVASRIQAVVQSDVVDGVMLDWWRDDDDRLDLIQRVRELVGDEILILANSNDRKTPRTAPYINGYFMECTRSKSPQDWERIADTLRWAEEHLKPPHINCLETWFHESRNDLHLMRATTTLSLVASNGYCLFSDPNPLPTPDHLHNWYDFWGKSLGKPVSDSSTKSDGSVIREFENGIAVYNPMGNVDITVRFDEAWTSVSSNQSSSMFSIPPGDGDILLKPGASLKNDE